MASVSTSDFWTDLYARGGDGWELRQPAPPLVAFVERSPLAPGRVAVPGCGRGHDVRFLARARLSAALGAGAVGSGMDGPAAPGQRPGVRRRRAVLPYERHGSPGNG